MFILHIDGKNIDEEENHHPNLFTWGSNEHCTFATEEIKPTDANMNKTKNPPKKCVYNYRGDT